MILYFIDKSVLENFHIASVFKLMTENSNMNIFKYLSNSDHSKIRTMIINMVLSTDMSLHFTDLAKVKGRLATSGFFLF